MRYELINQIYLNDIPAQLIQRVIFHDARNPTNNPKELDYSISRDWIYSPGFYKLRYDD